MVKPSAVKLDSARIPEFRQVVANMTVAAADVANTDRAWAKGQLKALTKYATRNGIDISAATLPSPRER